MILNQTANAVLVPASPLRMEAFSQMWLVKNGVLAEESSGFFTPVAVQCADAEVEVFLLPNRIQLASKKPTYDEAVRDSVQRMQVFAAAAKSALVPMSAGGLNAAIAFAGERPANAVRELFFKSAPWPQSDSGLLDLSFSVTEDFHGTRVTTKVSSGLHVPDNGSVLLLEFNIELPMTEASQFEQFEQLVGRFNDFCADKIDFFKAHFGGE